jgi:DNA primase
VGRDEDVGQDREFDLFLENLRAATDMVSLVQAYVPSLKRAGKSYKGICPFHAEKTPSFTISPDKGLYHCFGCGASGDAIGFVMAIEKIGFIEAVKLLAERAGIPFPERKPARSDDERDKLLAVCETACAFYQQVLRDAGPGSEPVEWLKSRGIDGRTALDFRIGFAPNAWDALARHAAGKGIDVATLAAAGLVVEKEGGGGYDRFRNRVIFPISTISGRVVAFGGRAMSPDEPAKYINSPETLLFRKGDTLYGLHRTKDAIRREGTAVLVEGYTDFLSVYTSGIEHVVATSGTALTESQARLLSRYSKVVIILYDGDDAGRAASERAVQPLLAACEEVRVALLPEGSDPDSFARQRGGEALRELLDSAVRWQRFVLDRWAPDFSAMGISAQTSVIERVGEYLRGVPDPGRRELEVRKASEELAVDEAIVRRAARIKRGKAPDEKKSATPVDTVRWEAEFLRLLIADEQARIRVDGEVEVNDLKDPAHQVAFEAILAAHREGVRIDPAMAVAGGIPRLDSTFVGRLINMPGKPEPLEHHLARIRKERFANEIEALRSQMARAKQEGDIVEEKRLFARYEELQRAVKRSDGS